MMRVIKKWIAVLAVCSVMTWLAGCGSSAPAEAAATQTETPQTDAVDDTEAAEAASEPSESSPAPETTTDEEVTVSAPEDGDTAAHSDVLVAYFSATGTTKGVAERIASVTGGDLYEILAAEPYTEEDLNYNDRNTRATMEQDDKDVRPEIGSEDLSLEGYTKVYLGFPIWWGEEPRILDTFVEKYEFDGITVIPFCTSGSSGIGRSGANMEALAGSGTWLEGKRFSGSVSEEELQSWISGME